MLNTRKVSIDSSIIQNPGNIVSDMAGEKVMMNVQKGKYYNLGIMGGLIWDKIQSITPVSKLIDNLLEEYSIDYLECKEQVLTFLEHLYNEGLIEIK